MFNYTPAASDNVPPESTWGWSEVVALVRTREEAEATIGLLTATRGLIACSVDVWETEVANLAANTWNRPFKHERVIRALKVIATHPAKRAEALLALDAHIACLRGEFPGITEA